MVSVCATSKAYDQRLKGKLDSTLYSYRYKARNNNGQIGLVPRNYLQELSEYLAQPFRSNGSGPDSLDRRPNDAQSNNNNSTANNSNNNNLQQPERPHLTGKSWYYGAITRSQCDTVLNSHGHDGDYLIRDSETNVSVRKDNCFAVSRVSHQPAY